MFFLLGALAAGPASAQEASADAGQTKAQACTACHGVDGNSVSPMWPSLAGQHPSYLVKQLKAFRDGARVEVTMTPFTQGLTDQDIADIAAYFAAQTLTPKGADPGAVSLGQQIYRGGVPQRGIAACIACHGPTGMGNPLAVYPRIAGQHSQYLAKSLHAYAGGERRTDADLNQMMRNVTELLLDEEVDALASYIQGLR